MAATKNLRTIIAAATSNTAASTTTGTAVDLTTKYGGVLTVKITNGGTGPTVPASGYVYTSGDNTNFKLMTQLAAPSTSGVTTEWLVDIHPGVMYLRVDVKDNTAQAVTCEAFLQELSSI